MKTNKNISKKKDSRPARNPSAAPGWQFF